MTLWQRRSYMFFFIALFIITAPIVVLFATGYRFDRTGKVFVHSGSITMSSWPRETDIYLNGEKQESKKLSNINNSYTINGIRPGRYLLSCKKDGYTSWEKEIDVHSGLSTEFWNIILYPTNSAPSEISSQENVQHFFLSPRSDEELVVFSKQDDKNKVSLLDVASGESIDIYETDQFEFFNSATQPNVEWSADKKSIIIPLLTKEGKNIHIMTKIEKTNSESDTLVLNELLTEKIGDIKEIRWMFDKNNQIVALSQNNELYSVNIEEEITPALIEKQVSGFNFAGNRIYYAQLPNNIIWEVPQDDLSLKRQITDKPINTGADKFIKIFSYDEYRIAAITPSNDLFVFNNYKENNKKSLDLISHEVKEIQFSDDGKKLLYWHENEIWYLMLRDWDVQPIRKAGQKIFITRFSAPLKNVQWLDDYENIIFSTNSTIKASEIDKRDKANAADIIKTSKDFNEKEAIYDKDSQTIFYIDPEKRLINFSQLIDKSTFFGLL